MSRSRALQVRGALVSFPASGRWHVTRRAEHTRLVHRRVPCLVVEVFVEPGDLDRGEGFAADPDDVDRVCLEQLRPAVYIDGCFWRSCPERGTKTKANNGMVGTQTRTQRRVTGTLTSYYRTRLDGSPLPGNMRTSWKMRMQSRMLRAAGLPN